MTDIPNATAPLSQRISAKQKRSQEKLDLILETTLKMLSSMPADKINTNEIARQAGVSIGTLYRFFPKKEVIYYELFRDWLQQTLRVFDSVADSFTGSERIEDCIEALLDKLSEDETINSVGHWKLRRSMVVSSELSALEESHQREIFSRLLKMQKQFGLEPAPDQALLQAHFINQISIACLNTIANAPSAELRRDALAWSKLTMKQAFLGKSGTV
ncbi:TetR/AcrR family transcriptional regulator [Kiloniella sp. b19]|uniref:TetR/AcrR family transcriptional regulator n=1 Tax=Kiloniella sp. GXU_MW_B19 TaxID=3141326 RepID=UPI0031E1D04A